MSYLAESRRVCFRLSPIFQLPNAELLRGTAREAIGEFDTSDQ